MSTTTAAAAKAMAAGSRVLPRVVKVHSGDEEDKALGIAGIGIAALGTAANRSG